MSRNHWSGYGTTFADIIWTSAWLLLPYLAWVTFAAALNCTIWRLNRASYAKLEGYALHHFPAYQSKGDRTAKLMTDRNLQDQPQTVKAALTDPRVVLCNCPEARHATKSSFSPIQTQRHELAPSA
jgi:TspO/MBR family protein